MFLILSGFAGLFAAFLLHWLAWTVRLKYHTAMIALGSLSALGLTGFCLVFLNSDIANIVMIALGILWALALWLGALQASALNVPWWQGVLGIFLEMGLAFIVGAAVNLALQRYIEWLDHPFPGIDVYAVINTFLRTMSIMLLVLAVLRPLTLLTRTHQKQSS